MRPDPAVVFKAAACDIIRSTDVTGCARGPRRRSGLQRRHLNVDTFEGQAGGTLVVLTDDLGLNGISGCCCP
jgi:hypothetical protein